MRKILLGFVVVLVISLAFYLRFRHPRHAPEVAYAANRDVILWSTSAPVREPVTTVHYGERLSVLDRVQDQVQVRTSGGARGWTSETNLLSEDFWHKAQDLEAKTTRAPAEALGRTKVLSNLHLEPGRDAPRIRQLSKDVPVELYERQAVEVPAQAQGAAQQGDDNSEPAELKKEDWWLVRAHLSDESTVSGWLLGRFVDLDVPQPLPDYASSAGMRIVAWFELNRASAADGNTKPQYLVVGTRGAEGQACDFTMVRVYTWGKQRQRYETAYVESDLCGKLPVGVTRAVSPGGDVTFTFEEIKGGAEVKRVYRMRKSIVRRERELGEGRTAGEYRRG